MKTKMLTLRLPDSVHAYLSSVAKKQNATIQNLCQVLLITCAQGMAKKDQEELEKIKKMQEAQEEGEGNGEEK